MQKCRICLRSFQVEGHLKTLFGSLAECDEALAELAPLLASKCATLPGTPEAGRTGDSCCLEAASALCKAGFPSCGIDTLFCAHVVGSSPKATAKKSRNTPFKCPSTYLKRWSPRFPIAGHRNECVAAGEEKI